MLTSARLITPEGKTIELSPEMYRKVQRLLDSKRTASPLKNRLVTIRATHGKYAGKASLTKSLLKQKQIEKNLEKNKLRRKHG
jgi:hypothetical protein